MGNEIARRPGYHRRKSVGIPERLQAFIDGELKAEDLDDEEVRRGQLRSKDGSFKGRPANYLPREFVLAIQREGQRRFELWIRESVRDAQQAVLELTNSRRLAPGDATRLKAAQFILERYAGKTPDRVEISAEVKKYEHVLEDILVDVEEDDDDFQ